MSTLSTRGEPHLILADIAYHVVTEDSTLEGSFTYRRQFTYEAIAECGELSFRARALDKVKRLIFEELMAHLAEKKAFGPLVLSGEQITRRAGEILKTEVLEEKWEGKTYHLRARIVCDPKKLGGSKQFLENLHGKADGLSEPEKTAESALAEVERLEKDLELAKQKIEIFDQRAERKVTVGGSDWLERGRSLMAVGDFHGAIEALNRAIEIEPEKARAYANRGVANFRLGDFEQAVKDFDSALEIDPGRPVILSNRGSARAELGEWDLAIEDYGRAIDLDSRSHEAYYNRGIAHLRHSRDFRAAVRDFNKCIELRPEDARCYMNRGVSLVRRGQLEEAIKDYDKSIALKVLSRTAYYNRGNALLRLGSYEAAIRDYTKTIELGPSNDKAYFNRAVAYGGLGDSIHAVADFDRVTEINPMDARAFVRRGFLYAKMGYETKAIEDWKKAAKLGDHTGVNYLRHRGIEYTPEE
jgi:tetratricopeptide (TPR) repeat protein